MQVYEITEFGYNMDYVPQFTFDEHMVLGCERNVNEIKIYYEAETNFSFPILTSWISILIQDIHNDIPCGMLHIVVLDSEGDDRISYAVRFTEEEFRKIKNFS